jgi:hypothetical protein
LLPEPSPQKEKAMFGQGVNCIPEFRKVPAAFWGGCERHRSDSLEFDSGKHTPWFDHGGFLHWSFRAFAGSKGATTLLWWMANGK